MILDRIGLYPKNILDGIGWYWKTGDLKLGIWRVSTNILLFQIASIKPKVGTVNCGIVKVSNSLYLLTRFVPTTYRIIIIIIMDRSINRLLMVMVHRPWLKAHCSCRKARGPRLMAKKSLARGPRAWETSRQIFLAMSHEQRALKHA